MEAGVHGGLLEVVLGHVEEDVRRGREVAVVHLQTMVEGLVLDLVLSLGLAIHSAVQVSSSILHCASIF